MRLYVGNLSYTTTEDTLRELFSNYGKVISVIVMRDRYTGQSKGFGFVEMATENMGERGIGGMNGKSVEGRRIRVTEAVEKTATERDSEDFAPRERERNFRRDEREYRPRRDEFRRDERDFYSRRDDYRRDEREYRPRREDIRRDEREYRPRRDFNYRNYSNSVPSNEY